MCCDVLKTLGVWVVGTLISHSVNESTIIPLRKIHVFFWGSQLSLSVDDKLMIMIIAIIISMHCICIYSSYNGYEQTWLNSLVLLMGHDDLWLSLWFLRSLASLTITPVRQEHHGSTVCGFGHIDTSCRVKRHSFLVSQLFKCCLWRHCAELSPSIYSAF